MFGYINPDKPYLFLKDDILYKAVYCGLCKSIGKSCGTLARTALSYDMAFLSALVHNIKNCDFTIKKQRCALHPFKKRPMAQSDDITLLIACANTALAYFKLLDDKADKDVKSVFSFLYKGGYSRVLKAHPQLINIIKEQTDEQNAIEKQGCESIDMACEPTAVMMQRISRYILGEYATEHTDLLFYSLGKWVYLADALDDYDKDVKKGSYNVLYNVYKTKTKAEAVKVGEGEITFILNNLFADLRKSLANIKFYFNHDLTDNIILRGIPLKSKSLVFGACRAGKKEKDNE
ncbi:MAG: hypothetical protein J6B04_06905 [Clostridia bacterium]|nr:hypothetical protein [Clostridia bacterium]